MIVSCPKCRDEVSLPSRVHPQAVVRCPLCHEEYELSEALAKVPPALEIVEFPEGVLAGSAYGAEPAYAAAAPGATFNRYNNEDVRSAPQLDDEEQDFRIGGSTEEITDDSPSDAADAPAFGAKPSLKPSPGMKAPKPSARKKRKAPNPIMEIIKIVLGGAMAVPITILLLLWLPGEWKKDPFELEPKIQGMAPWALPKFYGIGGKSTSGLAGNGGTPAKPIKPAPVPIPAPEAPGNQPEDKFAAALKDPTREIGPGVAEPMPNEPMIDPGVPAPSIDPPTNPTEPNPEPFVPAQPAENPEDKKEPDDIVNARLALLEADQKFAEALAGDDKAAKTASANEFYKAGALLADRFVARKFPIKSDDFQSFIADAAKQRVTGVLGARSITAESRPNAGIIVIGTVTSCKAVGSAYEANLELPGQDKPVIAVVLAHEVKEGDKLFAAGRLSSAPKDEISGYEGDAEKAIDAQYAQTLEAMP